MILFPSDSSPKIAPGDNYIFSHGNPIQLGTALHYLNASGAVAEQSRSADQWSNVKYAYYDSRR